MAAEGKTAEFAEAREVILEWLDFALTTNRRRDRVEAPMHMTARYLRLEAAWALARVGFDADTSQLSDDDLHELRRRTDTEQVVADLYDRRLSEARERRDPTPWSPAGLAPTLSALERFSIYRVHRTIEASYVLSPTRRPRSLDTFDGVGDEWQLRTANHSRSLEEIVAGISGAVHTGCADLFDYAAMNRGAVQEAIEATKRVWPRITDAFNTNDFYCFSVLAVFSAITVAIAQSVNPIPLLDSPPAAMS